MESAILGPERTRALSLWLLWAGRGHVFTLHPTDSGGWKAAGSSGYPALTKASRVEWRGTQAPLRNTNVPVARALPALMLSDPHLWSQSLPGPQGHSGPFHKTKMKTCWIEQLSYSAKTATVSGPCLWL